MMVRPAALAVVLFTALTVSARQPPVQPAPAPAPPLADPTVPKQINTVAGITLQFTVTPAAGTKLGVGKGFDPAGMTLRRNPTDDPNAYEYEISAYKPGAYYVTWWTQGKVTPVYTLVLVEAAPTAPGTAPPAAPKEPPKEREAAPPPAIPAAAQFPASKLQLILVEDNQPEAVARDDFFRERVLKARMDGKGHTWAAFTRASKDADAAPFIEALADPSLKLPATGSVVFVMTAEGTKVGEVRYAGPGPKTAAAMTELLDKYGG